MRTFFLIKKKTTTAQKTTDLWNSPKWIYLILVLNRSVPLLHFCFWARNKTWGLFIFQSRVSKGQKWPVGSRWRAQIWAAVLNRASSPGSSWGKALEWHHLHILRRHTPPRRLWVAESGTEVLLASWRVWMWKSICSFFSPFIYFIIQRQWLGLFCQIHYR